MRVQGPAFDSSTQDQPHKFVSWVRCRRHGTAIVPLLSWIGRSLNSANMKAKHRLDIQLASSWNLEREFKTIMVRLNEETNRGPTNQELCHNLVSVLLLELYKLMFLLSLDPEIREQFVRKNTPKVVHEHNAISTPSTTATTITQVLILKLVKESLKFVDIAIPLMYRSRSTSRGP